MGNVSFVILNYKTYQEAIACAESILASQSYPDIRIVIVDNGSGNESVEQLKLQFDGEDRVHIVAAEENLGFAKGNNLGIAYAREHYAPDFIVAANSDIIFEQTDYCEKLFEIYNRKPFSILGSDIVDSGRTQHFNPVARERSYSVPYMQKQIAVSYAKALAFRLMKLFHLKRLVENKEHVTTREENGTSVAADVRVEEEMEDVLLHGCCMVFSKDFFAEFEGFWPGTFLYAEEEIIYYLAKKKGMRVLYTPDLTCMHKEAVTTKQIYRDFCDAKIFYFSNVARSYRKFLKLMRESVPETEQ